MSRIYRRGDTWYGYWRDRDGNKHRASLCTTDKAVARERLRERETSTDRPADRVTLGAALTHLLEVVYAGRRASTVLCYTQKARHLERVLDEHTPLGRITRAEALRYRAHRLGELAAPGTIYKELVVLRLALKEQGIRDVVPAVSAEYVPRTTHLSPEQAHAVIATLPEHRRRWVMIAVYAGLRLSELAGLLWEDVDLGGGWLHVAGTKTKGSRRPVPIADELRPWLEGGGDGPVVDAWPNCTRDIKAACKRAKVPICSMNDLRRTFCSWLKQRGVDSLTVSKMMGNSTRMVDAVYGQISAETMKRAVAMMPTTDAPMVKLGMIEGGKK
jgi:integrase